ncbi:MAG: membrane protein insertion efficiency factor YidD [Acidithiobacillus ferrivorans]
MSVRHVAVVVVRGYQYVISPMLGQRCRFYPTCSEYACQAIERYGIAKGSWLGIKRISRCHPWHSGGVDPVP